MSRLRSLICFMLLLTALTACERRMLEIEESETALVRIEVDWDSLFIPNYNEIPSGMTAMLFADGDSMPVSSVTNNTRFTTFYLRPATYRLVLFNQSFDEFGSMRFGSTGSLSGIHVKANPIVTYENGEWDRGVRYIREPEPIGVALDTFTVTQDMLNQQNYLIPYTRSVWEMDSDTYVFHEVVQPMTATLNIRVHVRGIKNMRTVIGSITGLADGFQLSQIWRNETDGIHLLDTWQHPASLDNADDGTGWITISTPTHGLPHGKELASQRQEDDNIIVLCFTLIDGTTRTFTYNVGKHIHYIDDTDGETQIVPIDVATQASVTLDLELILDAPLIDDYPTLPDVVDIGGGSGGGFDAHVDDWEDGGSVDVGF